MDDKTSLLNQLKIDRTEPDEASRPVWVWWTAAVALLAVLIGGWLFWGRSAALAVTVTVAQSTAISGADANASMLDASGYVVARRQATVAAKTTGKVIEVLIDEGQQVAKDQVIARLDDTNAQAAFAQAKAQLAQSQANLDATRVAFANAEPIFMRYQKQLDKGVISAQDYDTAKSSYDATRSNLAVAERSVGVAQATLAVAQRNLDDTIVRAPFAGVITVKAAQPGEMISPMSAGGFTRTGIGTIVDMDSLEVEVDVSENFINRVHPQQPAVIKLNAYPDWSIPGAVIAVIPTADRSKATVKVRVGFKAKDPRVLPEMGARVSFLGGNSGSDQSTTPERPSVQVPAAAVNPQGGDQGVVFIVRDDSVERRVVKLGAHTGDMQLVIAGIVPGDKLVLGNLDALTDGAKVKIAK